MLDCAIARGRPVPDERLVSRLADDLAGGRLAALGPALANRCDLLELLAGVSDGRPGQGRDHPVAAVLALAGRHDTTEATRWASRNMDRPFTILGLTS